MPIVEEMAVTVVAHFIADHIKMQLGARVAPIDQAIGSAASSRPPVSGIQFSYFSLVFSPQTWR
jgi:hypothetical protein